MCASDVDDCGQLIVKALCLFFFLFLSSVFFSFSPGWLGFISKGGGSSHVASDSNVNSSHRSTKPTRSYFHFSFLFLDIFTVFSFFDASMQPSLFSFD